MKLRCGKRFIDMSDAPAVQFCGRVANNLYAAVGEPFDIFAGTFNKRRTIMGFTM